MIVVQVRDRAWFSEPVRRDNPRALARRLSTIQAYKPCSISPLTLISNVALHFTDCLALKIGYLLIMVQDSVSLVLYIGNL